MAKATDDLSKYGLKEVTVRLKLDKSDPRMPDMVINSPYDATIFARSLMENLDREYTMVVNLSNKLKPINYNIISIGDLTSAQVSLTNVFKSSILSNAYGFLFFHNHPSGDATPSDADMEMTKQMIEAGRLLNIPLFDHIIIAGKNRDYLSQSYFSFRENYKELFSANKAIDLAYIRSFSHGMTKAEKVGEQNRTFHTERGQRMDLKGQRDSVFSATIETKDAWCRYLTNASYFVTYNLPSAMQIVDRYPNGTAVATKEIWESIGYQIKEGEKGLSILSTRNGVESEKIVYELSQMVDQKNFSDSYLWSLKRIHAKDLYQTLAKIYPEIRQEGMSPSMAVQLMVRNEFAKAASKFSNMNSNTILSLEHFVTASVTYSILTRMFKETDRKIFFPVSDQQFLDLKKHRTLEPALRLFYEVEKQVSGRLSDCVKTIRKEYLERSKVNEESERTVLRGRASAVGILPETGNLAPKEPSGSVAGTGEPRAREDHDLLSSVSVGLQRSGVSLHGENEEIEEGRNAGSADAEPAMGDVDAGTPDRSQEFRGSRNGLQTVEPENPVSKSDTKTEPENFVSETDTKAETENSVSKSDTKTELKNPVSESDTKNSDRYEVHKLSENPYQRFRYRKSVAPLSEELLSNLSSENWTNNQKDEHKTGVFPVENAKENSIVPKEWAEVCDAALRDNPLMWFHGRQELVTEFSVALSTGFGNITDIVKKNLGSVEYGSGYRFREPDGKAKDFCSWFTPDGIILAKGRSIRDTSERILVSWEDAAQRIKELLLSGMYLPDSEMDLMRNKYLKDAAEAFAFTISDFDRVSPAMNDSFLHDLAKCTGTSDIKSYYPDRANLIMLTLKSKEGAGKLADLTRYYYDLIAFVFSSDQTPMIKRFLSQFRENILPKFDVIEQSYSAFPRTGFTYDNRPEIYISDEEMENLFRNIPTGKKFSFLEAVDNKVDPVKAFRGIYNSYQGATFGGRYYYDIDSSKISLTKEHIIGHEDIEMSYALNKVAKTVMDMQNHHRFLFLDDIKQEPIFASDWLSGEILNIFSDEDKLGDLIRYSEKILGRETVNEKDFGAAANLHVILSREIFSKEMAENPDAFSDLHKELQNLVESASKETKDKVHKAISHLEAFVRHDYHPFGNLSEQMAYSPSRLPEIIQKEKENPPKNIGFATEDSPEPEQLSFFDLLNQQENPVPDSDTKVEGKSNSEETNWNKLNPDAVKQHLEEDGVLHGEVIDEEELQKDSLVTMMETSAVRPNAEQEGNKPNDNFVISDDAIATGTPKVRFQKNVDALRTLFQIDKEKRAATREEKAVLAEYSGWGGLSAAFDKNNESWQKEYTLLKDLLPEEEYQSAIGSTLNAHYTGAEIIRGVYQMLFRMGFSGGKVLEPSMGTGHFFGLMPDSMAQKSTLTGVELDTISGRIAQLLYPSAKITIDGFEKTKAVNTYDLAVGNVPFGKYGVSDPKFNAMNLTIHNYFFVKALDEVRPGGLVCFLTSRYTMDAKDSKVRKYLAERAELVSAVRFPQDAFKETANAEVITDLLVFQKKERPEVLTDYPDWVSLGLTDDNIPVNEYFLDNPDHVFGTFATKSGPFGPDLAVLPQADRTIEEQFSSISVPHTYYPAIQPSVIADPEHPGAVPADPSLRDFSYGIIDGKLYYRDGEIMYPPAVGTMPENRIRAMLGLASKMHKVIDLQINGAEDQEIKAAQADLNETYDSFVKTYQRINSTANARAFSQDSDYFLLCGLEILDTKGKFVSKADIFTKRTISPIKAAIHCETAEDALVESVRDIGHVDLEHMNDLLGWGTNGKDRILKDLSGVIFRDPTYDGDNYYEGWETSDQYLSGNVRIKLEKAEEKASSDPRYTVNVDALKAVQPEPIEAADISIRLGATWIKKSYYEQFMRDLFQLKGWQARSHEILFEPITGKWKITEKNHFGYDNVAVNETYGTNRKNAAYILEDCLNLSATIVYDSDGHGHSWKNERETQLAQMKQEEVKRAFADWIMKDPVRRKDLTDTYNRIFNSTRERTFDGSYLKNHLPGINTSIQLRPHQLSAVARTLLSGNTLLAHAVGAGKTFEMIASAMEAKRLGLCHKSMFVVPNHLVEQWGKDFLLLYPGANILVADKKTFSKDNRKKFTARIAAGDYDAVIIGHSQFQMIPLSDEMQEDYFNREISSAVEAISRAKNEEFGSQRGFTVQQLQQFIKSMQHRLEKIMDKGTKDDVIRFEKLGIDRLYVDEAHNYKNLYFFSKLSRVPGVNSGSDTNKTLDLSMKVNYINKLTDYKGVIFATGTPVSNSVSECYTMMKYLEPQVLEENGFNNFDAWATTFGEVTTAMELAPEGNGFRMKQRFAKFYNVPELMKIFREVSDIKVSEDLQLDVPDAERETIVAKPSQDQKSMMEGLTKRAEAIHKHLVDPTEDNMLKITTDGRKIGLDPRLIDPDAFDDPESKINLAVEKIYQIWEETKKNKSTQMVFCDFSVPGKGGFNVYDDMKDKLISKGIPAEEIAFIHNANTDAKKEQLFSKVRAGNVRILFGSTAKMGEGTNCQERLIALHHLDAPWKPSELDQRDGRIIRQGNSNPKVHIFTYVTEGTFDAYLYQTLLRKQKFIGQIMTNKTSARQMDDVDDRAMNYAEIMAVTAGSPELREKLTLDNELASLRELRTTWTNNRMRLEDKVRETYPETIRNLKARIENYKTDKLVVEQNPLPAEDAVDEDGKKKFVGMEVNGKHYATVPDAADAIHAWANAYNPLTPQSIGHYRGFEVLLRYSSINDDFEVTLKNAGTYKENLGKSGYAFFTRLDHILDGLSDAEKSCTERLESTETALEDAKVEITKPFPQEEEYQAKEKRLAELNAVLSLNDNSEDGIEEESEEKTGAVQKAEEEDIKKALTSAPENFLHFAKECDPDIFSSASIASKTSINLDQKRIGFTVQYGTDPADFNHIFAEIQNDHTVKYWMDGADGLEKIRENYMQRVLAQTEDLYHAADVPIQNLHGESFGPSGHMITLTFLEKGELVKLFGSIDHGSLRLSLENGVLYSDFLKKASKEISKSQIEGLGEQDSMISSPVEAVAEPVENINHAYHPKL